MSAAIGQEEKGRGIETDHLHPLTKTEKSNLVLMKIAVRLLSKARAKAGVVWVHSHGAR